MSKNSKCLNFHFKSETPCIGPRLASINTFSVCNLELSRTHTDREWGILPNIAPSTARLTAYRAADIVILTVREKVDSNSYSPHFSRITQHVDIEIVRSLSGEWHATSHHIFQFAFTNLGDRPRGDVINHRILENS